MFDRAIREAAFVDLNWLLRPPGGQTLAMRLALAIPALCVFVACALHHQFWGDELHAWALVRESADLPDLFHKMHYDGHPALWHLMLWLPAMLTGSLDGMRAAAMLLGAAIILVIALAAPLRMAEKILLLLNYYIAFEYTVMARNYGIGLLLAMLYALLRRDGPRRPILCGLLLGLMSNTNVYALFLAGFLALEFAWSAALAPGVRSWAALRRVLPGGAIYVVLSLFAAWTLWPPADASHFTSSLEYEDPVLPRRIAVAALRTLTAPFLPVDLSFPNSFAFPGTYYATGTRVITLACLLPFILAALYAVLRRHRPLALAFAGTCVAVTVFPLLVWPAQIRHLGAIFIAFIAVLFVVRDKLPARSWPVLALLAAGALGGGAALAGQWMRPFASGAAAVAWIREHKLEALPLVGELDWNAEPVAFRMNRPFFSLACQTESRMAQLRAGCDGYYHSMAVQRLTALGQTYPAPAYLLLVYIPFSAAEIAAARAAGFDISEAARFTGFERDNNLMLYLAVRRGS